MTIHGFGFIKPEDPANLKVKFSSLKGDIQLEGGATYVLQGNYVDKHTITVATTSMERLQYADGSKVKVGDPIYPEVSNTHDDDFTDNRLPVYHYIEV